MNESVSFTDISQWNQTLDEIEDQLQDRLIPDIPPLAIGESFIDPSRRLWQRLPIAYGKTGGRWCYWRRLLGEPDSSIVVDSLFNPWSSHFAGMLLIPYDGLVTNAIVCRNIDSHDSLKHGAAAE